MVIAPKEKLLRFAGRLLKALGIVILLITVIIAMLIAVIAHVDWNQHQDLVATGIVKFTDYRLEKLRSLEFKLSWAPSLTAVDFAVQPSAPHTILRYISAARFHLRVELIPLLLRHEIQVDELELLNAQLKLRVPTDQPSRKPQAAFPSTLPFIATGSIREFLITISDQKSAVHEKTIHIEQFIIASPGPNEPIAWHGYGSVMSIPMTWQARMGSLAQFNNRQANYPVNFALTAFDDQFSIKGNLQHTHNLVGRVWCSATGHHLQQMLAAFGVERGKLPPYKATLLLDNERDRWRFSHIAATLGTTKFTGNISFNDNNERLHITSTTTFAELNIDEVMSLVNTPPAHAAEPRVQSITSVESSSLDEQLPLDFLTKFDAHVAISVQRITHIHDLISSGTVTITNRNGHVIIDPLVVNIAQGAARGHLLLNAQRTPATAEAHIGLHGIEMSTITALALQQVQLPKISPQKVLSGKLAADIDLQTDGTKLRNWINNLHGYVRLAAENGKISSTLVHATSIDIPKTIGSLVMGNPTTDIQCFVAVLKVQDGVLTNQIALLATSQYNIFVFGRADLNAQTVDYTIDTRSKDFSIGTTQSPIHIKGPWHKIDLSILSKEMVTRLGVAAVAATVNPAFALVPLVDMGLAAKGKCSQYKNTLLEIESQSIKKAEH